MEGQRTIHMTDLRTAPPTVHDHTNMTDGIRLHTIDPDERRDIDIFNDDRAMTLAGTDNV